MAIVAPSRTPVRGTMPLRRRLLREPSQRLSGNIRSKFCVKRVWPKRRGKRPRTRPNAANRGGPAKLPAAEALPAQRPAAAVAACGRKNPRRASGTHTHAGTGKVAPDCIEEVQEYISTGAIKPRN